MKLSSVLIAVLACTSFLLAQQAAAPAPEKSAVTKRKAGSVIMGSVISIDATAITVKTENGEESIGIESSTKVRSGTKQIAPADIKAGSDVFVLYRTIDGKKVAFKIVEKSGGGEKKATAEPAAK
jgi:ribosomal protein S1